MSEKILSIDPDATFSISTKWSEFDGYKIKTSEQEILIGISNSASCCESFGYFSTNDDYSEFVGSDLIEIKLTDTALNTKTYKEKTEDLFSDEGGIQFVDLVTSKGSFQIAVYNSHNGYYGHYIVIKSKQVNHEAVL